MLDYSPVAPPTSASVAAAGDITKPSYRIAAVTLMSRAINYVRDLYAGTFALRDKANVYLPQMPAEDDKAYKSRIDSSELFNAFKKSVSGLVGLVFSKEMTLATDVAPKIKELCEDIDLEGNHVSVFAKDLFTDALRDGHVFVLTEMNAAVTDGANETGVPTLADEVLGAGLRPYWVKYLADQAVNWRHALVRGRRVLTQITFEEVEVEDKGDFGETVCTQYRVLRLTPAGVVGQVWRQVQRRDAQGNAIANLYDLVPGDEYTLKTMRGTALTEIPLAVCYGERTGLFTSQPPLTDLALLNVKHFRMTSDLHNLMHICNVPILWARGRDTSQKFQPIGSTILIDLDANEHSALGYAEVTAAGLENTQEEIDRIERRMAALGLEMLREKGGEAITATEYVGNQAQSTSALATSARSLQDCLEQSAKYLALFLGLDAPEGGSFVLNISWNRLSLSADEINALLLAKDKGVLDTETILELMQAAGRLPDGVDIKTILERLYGADMVNASEQERSLAAAKMLTDATAPPPAPDTNRDPEDANGDDGDEGDNPATS
jgi:ribosomal protein L12E/L44/L45/RPP1/RPP2